MNLPAERLTASAAERLQVIEEAASLRKMAKRLRANSEDLRRRNIVVVREADALARRCIRISSQVDQAGSERCSSCQ